MLKGKLVEWRPGPGSGDIYDGKEERWLLYTENVDPDYFPSSGDNVLFEAHPEHGFPIAVKVRKAE
ncbi:hypothetical protein [Streptomyces sp. NPDC053427]|uniref:hypothetical protein n=1 Tax=Streptomyces sp. NPDC053427 TaxID=3365701 RepID=UPI0037CF3604